MTNLNRRFFLKSTLAGVAALSEAKLAFSKSLNSLELGRIKNSEFVSLASKYQLDPRLTYLNHGSIGTIPRIVGEAHKSYLDACESNPWLYMWGGAWEEVREDARKRAAELLGCSPGEVSIQHNTTEGFNLLANGLPLGKGDEVLFSSLNHAGASICWEHQARLRGFTVKKFDFPLSGVPQISTNKILEIYDKQISPATRVLVFPHIDNIVGIRHPMKELAGLAHGRGVEFVAVDGAQSLGMIPIAMEGSGVDFFANSPHKWIQSPKGLGLFYARKELHGLLPPMWVTWGQKRWKGTARIYEDYGTRNLPEVMALGDALDFQSRYNPDAKEKRYQLLWKLFRNKVREAPRLIWKSPHEWQMAASLFSFEVENRSSAEVFEKMFSEWGYVFRPFSGDHFKALRISPNLFNTEEEIEKFFNMLGKV
jgi:selenocysteine lyase/cysteine desulfurase